MLGVVNGDAAGGSGNRGGGGCGRRSRGGKRARADGNRVAVWRVGLQAGVRVGSAGLPGAGGGARITGGFGEPVFDRAAGGTEGHLAGRSGHGDGG